MKCEHTWRAVCWLCSDQVSWWKEARRSAGLPDLHKPATAVLVSQKRRRSHMGQGSVLLRAIREKARKSGIPEERLINELKQAVWNMKI